MNWHSHSMKRRLTFNIALVALTVFCTVLSTSRADAAPQITGTPKSSIQAGETYRFKPGVKDMNQNNLKFSIAKKPGWTTFNSNTGRFAGTPGNAHVGTYSNIVISVTDGKKSASLGPFSIRVTSGSGSQPPTIEPDPEPDSGSGSGSSSGSGSGSGSSSGSSSGSGSGSFANDNDYLLGNPDTSVVVGSTYRFEPDVTGMNTSNLNFSIKGKPSWARFRGATGRLKGDPGNGDIGIHGQIIISVTDGKKSESIGPFSIEVTPVGGGSTSSGGNSAPRISGQPSGSVVQGNLYSFTPTASDANGDSLKFTISGRPDWASFSSTTGRLRGTPGPGDVGSYKNIEITVSDGKSSDRLGPFSVNVVAVGGGAVTLQWTPPTKNTDGTSLQNLAAYEIEWGLSGGSFNKSARINNPGISTYVVDNLAAGTYKFRIRAINSSGNISEPSNVVTKTVQ